MKNPLHKKIEEYNLNKNNLHAQNEKTHTKEKENVL